MIVGVMKAMPGKPYEFRILTSIRFFRVKSFFFKGGFLGGKFFIRNQSQALKIHFSKKRKEITPQIPAMVDTINIHKKPHFVAAYNAGTPTTNFTMQSRKIGMILNTTGYFFVPYAKSPASPKPGTMYDFTVSSSSTAPSQIVEFSGILLLM